MTKNKTYYTNDNIVSFLETISDEQKKRESYQLLQLMSEISGEEPKMFGSSIIGFGKYKYIYDSGHAGEAPLIGFSPRKHAFSLYVYYGSESPKNLLSKLGNFKTGKTCIYVKTLCDLELEILTKIIQETIEFLSRKYERIRPANDQLNKPLRIERQ